MATCPAGHESQASDYCDTCGRVIGGAAAAPAAAATTVTAVAAGVGAGAPTPRAGGCPVCGAGRDGRFCEECGYDFELAEAMPEVLLTPGIGPAETSSASNGPAAAETVSSAAAPAPEGGAGGAGGQGLDLEAELARAEAAAAPGPTPVPAQPVAPVPAQPTVAPTPAREPDPVSSAPVPPAPAQAPVPPPAVPVEELTLVVNADRDYYDAQVERGDIVGTEFPFPKYPAERRFSFTEGPVRIGRASSSRGLSPEIDLTGPPLDPAVSHLHAQLLRHDEGWVVVDLGSANGTRLNDAAEPLEAETEIPVKPGDRIHLGVWTTILVQ